MGIAGTSPPWLRSSEPTARPARPRLEAAKLREEARLPLWTILEGLTGRSQTVEDRPLRRGRCRRRSDASCVSRGALSPAVEGRGPGSRSRCRRMTCESRIRAQTRRRFGFLLRWEAAGVGLQYVQRVSRIQHVARDATVLARNGAGLAQIARQVGNWNNPTLEDWAQRLEKLVSPASQQALHSGPARRIPGYRVNSSGNWSQAGRTWADVLKDSSAWMEVRHLLTHGLATGWRVESWPPPIKRGAPPASSVLRPKNGGKHSLDRTGAKTCANLYTLGAKHVADVVAADLAESLDWSDLPVFK